MTTDDEALALAQKHLALKSGHDACNECVLSRAVIRLHASGSRERRTGLASKSLWDRHECRTGSREQWLEEAAKVCDDYSRRWWDAYKTGTAEYRADTRYGGMSDGCGQCADAIRSLLSRGEQGKGS